MSSPLTPLMPSSLPPSLANHGTLSSRSSGATKLADTAREFEAILLGQWLQAAESSFATVPGAEEDSDNGGDQMKSFGVQQMAKALSDAGGVGIAKLVSKALDHGPHTPESSQAPLIKTVSR